MAGSSDLMVWLGSPPGRSLRQRPQSQLVGAQPGVVVPERLGQCQRPCYHHPSLLPQLPAAWLSWLLSQRPGEIWLLLWLLLTWWVQLLASDDGNKHEKSLNITFIFVSLDSKPILVSTNQHWKIGCGVDWWCICFKIKSPPLLPSSDVAVACAPPPSLGSPLPSEHQISCWHPLPETKKNTFFLVHLVPRTVLFSLYNESPTWK